MLANLAYHHRLAIALRHIIYICNAILGDFEPTALVATLLHPIGIERHSYHVVFTSVGFEEAEHTVVAAAIIALVEVDYYLGVGKYSLHSVVAGIVQCREFLRIVD